MKILHVVASVHPSYGGPAYSVPRLARAMAELGHETGVWSPGGTEAEEFAASYPGVVNLGGLSRNTALHQFRKPDWIIDHGIWLTHNHEIAIYCKRADIPRVVSVRGMLDPWARKHKFFKKSIAWFLYQRRDLLAARFLHASSPIEKRHLEYLKLGIPIHTIPNGVDIPANPTRSVSDPSAPLTFFFLGRKHPVKGLPILARAWAAAAPPDWKMVVAGPDEGGHEAKLQNLLSSLGIRDQWSFHGTVKGDRKEALFAEADVVVLPSHMESFGLAAAEGMAHARPVLTTTGTPWSEVEKKGCGWYVNPSIESLSDALREIARLDRERLREMGQLGRDWMTDSYSWNSVAKLFLSLLERRG